MKKEEKFKVVKYISGGDKLAEEYRRLIEDTIKTVINQFHRKPYNFFNEHEFHQYCYHVFYSKKQFSKQFKTKDEKKTNLLHPEYPTLARFSRERIELDPKGSRARYDISILNPSFIQENDFDKIQNRDIHLFSEDELKDPSDHIIAAIEFKFINKHSKNYIHELKYDNFKLKNAREAKLKYMLVFANTIENEIDYFSEFDIGKDIKAIYVSVYTENAKKKSRTKQYPDGWLFPV